ncbi:hypothetical protein ACFFV7_33590 [Nonomuraea spiralis]|uniref:Uncharacterized protein n=1 Tax=Nonomuraea spiralis TaxID=46182 RepID=A0ABV5INM9_9ACTN|nr:hypothetical protein [Nonomuraea spiralis]GGT33022.1 hypothetical protein GCM10010176_091980 [Nonomuraea spiralis]
MGSNLRWHWAGGTAMSKSEFTRSSVRLAELFQCSAMLRRTRMRAEEIVDEARSLLVEAESAEIADPDRIERLRGQLEEARASYSKVLTAYVTLCRRINEERQEILAMQMEMELNRNSGLPGVA